MKPVSIGFILSMRLVLALHTEAVVLGGDTSYEILIRHCTPTKSTGCQQLMHIHSISRP